MNSDRTILSEEVESLLLKEAISEISSENVSFSSALFIIPKKSGGFRPIINLKYLNEFIIYRAFKMENLESIKYLIQENDWFTKLDLLDAYLVVPLNVHSRKFVSFSWDNRQFVFNSLAFGLSSAPWAFTKLMRPVVALFRRKGIRLVIYLDDILILSNSKENASQDFSTVSETLQKLGFLINWKKTVKDPSQSIEI